MIRKNPIKKGLKEGKSYIGTFAKMTDPSVVELFSLIGFDFFVIDNEHSHMSKETMDHLLRTADISGIVPIVRIRQNNRSMILQSLDGGSLGIMVPETSSRRDVEEMIYNSYYSPIGGRGFSPSHRAAGYGFMDGKEYAGLANEHVMTIAYCETAEALNNLDDMLGVPGLDVMWIGPMDLSQALGVIGDSRHPKVQEAVAHIIERCKAAGVAAGTIAANGEEAKKLLDMGVQFIGLSSDQAMIAYAGKAFMKELKD
ncbi:HpcH/HpaI aldolase family protein [Lacrimispora sp.]|uniref:HpcH/HpaI aldolase family protein n=1 Tax=Lacrimispora sp. TaxID=2719234 RepID=UPI0028AC2E7B|nr:aldolase/citrate lyase family protein [Lacrimispora sp.]